MALSEGLKSFVDFFKNSFTDDGQDDPEQPASRVTILNPNFSKKF